MIDVALVCCMSMRALDVESEALTARLIARGVHAEMWSWDDPSHDWCEARLLIMRSAWNYHLEFDAFTRWLNVIESAGTRMLNPPELIRWNADKRYLEALGAQGVPVVPTHYIDPGEGCDLDALLETWGEVVIKPTCSAGAIETLRVDPSSRAEGREHLTRLADRALMIQPLIRSILSRGERSQIYLNGVLSHVVDKQTRPGDFRIQEHHGGRYTLVEAAREADLEVATRALAQLDVTPLYARVDCVDDDAGQPLLMELEMIEPDLYLRHCPDGAARVCDAIEHALTQGP